MTVSGITIQLGEVIGTGTGFKGTDTAMGEPERAKFVHIGSI